MLSVRGTGRWGPTPLPHLRAPPHSPQMPWGALHLHVGAQEVNEADNTPEHLGLSSQSCGVGHTGGRKGMNRVISVKVSI